MMMTMDWKKLQNGSDIRGVALEGVPGEQVNLTDEVARILGLSFVEWLRRKGAEGELRIAIGTDCRLSGPSLSLAFANGARKAGATVVSCGLASTPAMFMTTVDKELNVAASVMVTASHLPFNRNGLKFFTPKGGLDKGDIATLLDIAEQGAYHQAEAVGGYETADFMTRYARHLENYIRQGVGAAATAEPLKGMHIVVDAGNGDGGFFEQILRNLGADTEGSQFLEPDGRFPITYPTRRTRKPCRLCAKPW